MRDQLIRPVFGKLNLRDKVRFLPYETIDDIDRFFAGTTAGQSVELVQAGAEALI